MVTKREEATGQLRPFKFRPDDRDYSGTDIKGQTLSDGDCARSFFNGTNLTDSVFRRVSFANCEFAEARFVRCHFEQCDFTSADLVSAQISETVFEGCAFTTGEWREVSFDKTKFASCSFERATVALCVFAGSAFDQPTIASLQHRAVAQNVFTLCQFEHHFQDGLFIARNFGTPVEGQVTGLIIQNGSITLADLCTLNNSGEYRATLVAQAAENVCAAIVDGTSKRTSALLFLSKIIRVLAQERRISATTLVYLEAVITSSAGKVAEQELFVMAMQAAVEIRTALFAISTEIDPSDDQSSVEHITIYFARTYARRQAELLANLLASTSGLPHEAMYIEKFHNGSTLIDIAVTAAVTTSTVLVSLNFALRQAKITLERLDDIKKAFKKLKGKPPRVPSREIANGPTRKKMQTERRPASVIGNPQVVEQLAPVRRAVTESGRVLIEFDEPVSVQILAKQPN